MTLEQKIRTVDKLCDEHSCIDCPCRDDGKQCLNGMRDKPWIITPEYVIDEALKRFGKHTPYTNFDRIKAMSVEEMAEKYVEFIMQQKSTLEQTENTSVIVVEAFKRDLFIQTVKWLESEVQEDD